MHNESRAELMVECATVSVEITDGQANVALLTLPAFTVSMNELGETVANHLADYLSRSMGAASGVSLADFALYLVARASQDPTRQPRDSRNPA